MKIWVISDIHGSSFWKYILSKKLPDKVVFLGDYFDCWVNEWPQQMENFMKIIKFKEKNFDKVDMLWGNHDTSYLLGDHCSGFQKEKEDEIVKCLEENFEYLQAVSIYDKWIFSHAGVSRLWMNCAGVKTPENINDLFLKKPDYFRWVGPQGSGDNDNEGPFWIRPNAFFRNYVEGWNQAVGHTELPEPRAIRRDGNMFVFTDTGRHNVFTKIDIKMGKIIFEDLAR